MNHAILKSRARTLVIVATIAFFGISAAVITGCSGSHSAESTAAVQPADPTASADSEGVAAPLGASTNVLTYHNDNARTGLYASEKILTPRNVNSRDFGKIGFLSVHGLVDAEPLYVAQLTIARAKHNVVFVVTEHDLAYAFDADSFAPLWQVSLLGPDERTSDDRGCGQVKPEIGVTSTPVIDLQAGPHGAVYVVAMSKNSSGKYFQRLHALDVTTGAELDGGSETIEATYPGSAIPNSKGQVDFDPKQYKERASLLLLNGVVYTSWASHCDFDPYTGWIIGYDAHSLKQTSVLNIMPNGSEGAIWMSGAGLAADSSANIYFLAGNGTFETTLNSQGFPDKGDYGNAFVKLSTSGGKLSVSDYFMMHNTVEESRKDLDLGSGGAMVLPDLQDNSGKTQHLAVGAGKDDIIYVVNRDSMGKFNPSNDSAIYQAVPRTGEENSQGLGGTGGVFAAPAYFNHTLYYGAVDDSLRAFKIANARVASPAASKTAITFGYPGTTPSISANGTKDAIVWAVENNSPAVLRAYEANDLTRELYDSNKQRKRDEITGNKFITPMIADGKVFVGTPTGVTVFGLLPKPAATPSQPQRHK
ncbi:MAG: pyrrolo-quinoline quinone [Candidatus Acidiferrales bacterium]